MLRLSERDKPIFIMTIGISGAGKSTWIKEQTSDPNVMVINPDSIRKELTGDISDQSQNAKVWYITKRRVLEGLNSGKTVILDATNVDSRSRRDFINDLPPSVLKAKIFNVDPEEAKRRVRKALESGEDRSNVPPEVIDRQYQKFLASTPDKLQAEGFELI